MSVTLPWHHPDGITNAAALLVDFPQAFSALEEVERFGHRLLIRMAQSGTVTKIDSMVGLAFARRALTQFVALRHLLEHAACEPAKLNLRAIFELNLAIRYLVHGARQPITPKLVTSPRARETRARYLWIADKRRTLYARQAMLDGRWVSRVSKPADRKALRAEIAENLTLLNTHFRTQQLRFGALRCLIKGRAKVYYDKQQWYSFGFPRHPVNSIAALARALGEGGMYNALYGALSGLAHAGSITHDFAVNQNTMQLDVHHPYLVDAFGLLCRTAVLYQSSNHLLLSKAYHPSSLSDAQATFKLTSSQLAGLPSSPGDAFL